MLSAYIKTARRGTHHPSVVNVATSPDALVKNTWVSIKSRDFKKNQRLAGNVGLYGNFTGESGL